jgi:phosphatidylinositol alpha-mannosyltransferase
MKIGIVSPYYIDRFGGVQSHIIATRNELIKRGHEVKIIAPKARKAGGNQEKAHVISIGTSAEIKFKSFATTFPVAMSVNPKEIDTLLEAEKFDILHVHEPYMIMLPYQIVQKAKCPVVGTLHANKPDSLVNKSVGRAARGYFKTAATKIDTLTAVSTEAGRFALKGVDKQVRIVPNGIELKSYNRLRSTYSKSATKELKTIVYIGRLEKRKGAIYLLKAFQALQADRDNIALIIAGSGPNAKSLKDYARRNKLQNVQFVGHVSEAEKKSLLKSADVYCSPALYGESFGIVLLEAMAMGAVTVAGDNPGYSSVMSGRGRLSLIDPLSTNDFKNRLDLMLFDQEIRRLWLDWAKEYVQQFDYSVVTDKYEEIYKELIDA